MDSEQRFKSLANVVGDAIERRIDAVDFPQLFARVGVGLFLRSQPMALAVALAFGAGIVAGALVAPTTGSELRLAIRKRLGRWAPGPKTGQVVTSGGERMPPFDEGSAGASKDGVRAERRAEGVAEVAAGDGKLGPV